MANVGKYASPMDAMENSCQTKAPGEAALDLEVGNRNDVNR